MAAPAATGVTLVLALVLIALGVIAVRDVLLWTGAITGTPWIINALKYFDGLTPQEWMLPAGIAVAILGVLLVLRRRQAAAPDPSAAQRPRHVDHHA